MSLLTTMMQPMDSFRERRHLDFLWLQLLWPWLGLADHISYIIWSAKMYWQPQWSSACSLGYRHMADVSMAFCKLCKLLLRENGAAELPPEPGLWNLLDLAGFEILWGVCWGGVLHFLSRNLFSAAKDLMIVVIFLVVGRRWSQNKSSAEGIFSWMTVVHVNAFLYWDALGISGVSSFNNSLWVASFPDTAKGLLEQENGLFT